MWNRVLDNLLSGLIRHGDLLVTLPGGDTRRYGDGHAPLVSVTLHTAERVRKICLSPELAVGEGYMDESLTVENDDLYGFLDLATRNVVHYNDVLWLGHVERVRRLLAWVEQRNVLGRAKDNVAHHYDLSGALYDLFLDEDKQYSCAYFRTPDDTLETAQAQKKAHIAGKLLIEPGMRVLDIGCGWGGMGLTLARDYGARVVGVTLSEEQHRIAVARAAAKGLEDRVEFRLMDYREVDETFDRIVSVGMFEHVGRPHFREYFGHVRDKLTEDGIALIHTIGRTSEPATTSAWFHKHIFPGGYIPSLSEIAPIIEESGLFLCDLEVLRKHYAYTLKAWSRRVTLNRSKILDLYDVKFLRMWNFYLLSMENSFAKGRFVNFQFLLTKCINSLPLTREYQYRIKIGDSDTMAAE